MANIIKLIIIYFLLLGFGGSGGNELGMLNLVAGGSGGSSLGGIPMGEACRSGGIPTGVACLNGGGGVGPAGLPKSLTGFQGPQFFG
jgi:hypothetical protein